MQHVQCDMAIDYEDTVSVVCSSHGEALTFMTASSSFIVSVTLLEISGTELNTDTI